MNNIDLIGNMTSEDTRALNAANFIEESLHSPICNDDQDWVILRTWFKGDKRDGIAEVFYCCENPPSDIDNYIFTFIYDMTGLTLDLFQNAKVIRVRGQESEKKLRDQMAEWPEDELTDMQLILSMAQAHAEFVYRGEQNLRMEIIERFSSRTTHAMAQHILNAKKVA